MLSSVSECFDSVAFQFSENIAVCYGDKKLTYCQLHKLVDHYAKKLLNAGVQRNDLIAVCSSRSPETLASMLAIMKLGAAFVPIDSRAPINRISFVLADADCKLVCSDEDETLEALQNYAGFKLEDYSGDVLEANRQSMLPLARRSDLAYVIYTSGSTGKPKGVMIDNAAVLNLLQGFARRLSLDESHKWLGLAPYSFDMSIADWLACLCSGGTYVILDEAHLADPFLVVNAIQEHKINLIQATPSRWQQLLNTGWKSKGKLVGLCGGEALSLKLAEKIKNTCDVLWHCYGPTEATVWSLVRQIAKRSDPACCVASDLYLAAPLDNYQHYVLDENLDPVEKGSMGELCIAGPGLARGYLRNLLLTNEVFAQIKAFNGERIRVYRTGDLVIERGPEVYEFCGRNDFQIKINGYRVETAEIQQALMGLPEIEQAEIVLVKADDKCSELLCAFLSLAPDLAKDYQLNEKTGAAFEERCRAQLKKTLPDYMCPAIFKVIEKFPLNANGKVDRGKLEALLQAGPPKDKVVWLNDMQKELAQLWTQVLGHARFDQNTNYFSIGGNSLNAASLIRKITDTFPGVHCNVSDVLLNPTIQEISDFIAHQSAVSEPRDYASDKNEKREVFSL